MKVRARYKWGARQVTVLATKGGQTLAQKQLDVSAEGK